MRRCYVPFSLCALLVFSGDAAAAPTTFDGLKARFSRSESDRRLVDKAASLLLDDETARLTVRTDQRPLSISYGDLQHVVFDVSRHMRGGVLGAVLGGVVGMAIMAQGVNDYWCHIAYRDAEGVSRSYMLEVPKERSKALIEHMQRIFNDRVTVADFTEQEAAVDKAALKDLQSKHDLKVDKTAHPFPEPRPELALIVVVCPPLAARTSGKGNQVKLHVDDRVVAVNKMGTYSFAYVEPGEHLLVSQTENASGFRMELKAGETYYFLQNTFTGAFKSKTSLSRHARELVMHELSGAHFAKWVRK